MRHVSSCSSGRVRSFAAGRAVSLGLLFCLTAVAGARQQSVPVQPPIDAPGTKDPVTFPGAKDEDPNGRMRAEGQVRSLANDRQKRLLADTDKLVELSNELKIEVSKTTKNDLSLTVIKKATEIEKLAREVKERERN